MPGMRMSETIASGRSRPSAVRTSLALLKLRTSMSAFCRAFSSTQRIDRSSSTTHTSLR